MVNTTTETGSRYPILEVNRFRIFAGLGSGHGVSDLHMAQLMPLPLTVSCFSKIQNGTGLPG